MTLAPAWGSSLLCWRSRGLGCGLTLPISQWSLASLAASESCGLPEGRGADRPTRGSRATFCGYSGAVCGLRAEGPAV